MATPVNGEIEAVILATCDGNEVNLKQDGQTVNAPGAGVVDPATGVMMEAWYEAGSEARVLRSDIDGNLLVSVDGFVPPTPPVTGNFDSTSDDEATAGAAFVRAALTAQDPNLAAGDRNIPLKAIAEPGSTILGVFAGVAARQDGYAAARRGRRFYATDLTPATALTCTAGFLATTPALLLANNAAALSAVILRNINLSIKTAPGDLLQVVVAIDSADRYSAAGTAVVPQGTNTDIANLVLSIFYTMPTASAAGAGTRYIYNGVFPGTKGTNVDIEFLDGVIIGSTGSILIYVFSSSGAGAPAVLWNVEFEEVV